VIRVESVALEGRHQGLEADGTLGHPRRRRACRRGRRVDPGRELEANELGQDLLGRQSRSPAQLAPDALLLGALGLIADPGRLE
jgi:hypothetical protein